MQETKLTTGNASALNQECIADKLRLLHRVITNLYDERLRPAGITASQMNIMVVVAKYGSANPSQVGRWLHMEKSTLSRNLKLLRGQGLIEARRSSGSRSMELRNTVNGERVLRRGLPLWRKAQREAKSLLGEGGVKEVMRVANILRSDSR